MRAALLCAAPQLRPHHPHHSLHSLHLSDISPRSPPAFSNLEFRMLLAACIANQSTMCPDASVRRATLHDTESETLSSARAVMCKCYQLFGMHYSCAVETLSFIHLSSLAFKFTRALSCLFNSSCWKSRQPAGFCLLFKICSYEMTEPERCH